MNIDVNIDTMAYKKKPVSVYIISTRISKNIENISLEEFIDRVGAQGTAFTRAILKGGRKNENFQKQRLLVLDFDGTLSEKDFQKRCQEYNLSYLFLYRTFSWSREEHRFRAVFLIDRWIEKRELANVANLMLNKIFPEADQACKDLCRIFFGGKKVIDYNLNASLNISDLARATENYICKISKKNYIRDLNSFARSIGVKICEKRLCIFEDNIGFEKSDNIISDNGIQMIFPEETGAKIKEKIQNWEKKDITIITKYDTEGLCELCPLLKDFAEGNDIHHDLKFMLATNLQYFKCGKNLFFSCLTEKKEKWARDWKNQIVTYLPTRCAKYPCPYCPECKCNTLYEKASRKIQKLSEQDEFYPLEECRMELRELLVEAIDSKENGIYVLKAQTAIGKTEQYCELVKNHPEIKFIIVVPTLLLQWEVVSRLEKIGVKCCMTESIAIKVKNLGISELNELIEEAFECGYGVRIVKIIRNFRKEHYDQLTVEQKKGLEQILKKAKIEETTAQCIVTTHALFLLKEMYRMDEYVKIVDEDILMTLFRQTHVVPLKTLEKLLEEDWIFGDIEKTIRDILKMEDHEVMSLRSNGLPEKILDEMYLHRQKLEGPVPLLFGGTHVVMDKKNNKIVFGKKSQLDGYGKLIILSATANKKLYEDYFKGHRVIFRSIHNAKYKGKVVQYTAHSLSRAFFMANGMSEVVKRIQDQFIGEIPIIGFKMLFPNSKIHFGKTEGFNEYKGKNIAVVGTPHTSPVLYKLIGAMLGYCTAGEMKRRKIKRNGYSFSIMTYSNEEMQNLQLFFIESELEQAIGRARLLNEECTVYVFSNYPCQQAELRQNPYLNLDEAAEEDLNNEKLED